MQLSSAALSGSNGPDGEALAFFTSREALIVAQAMGRIFPAEASGPGAIEAGAHYYLDRALSGAELDLQQPYRTALARLDAIATGRFGGGFTTCSEDQQDELIGLMADGQLPEFGVGPSATEFFEMLRSHTLEGVFADPVHGGNRNFVGWNLLGYPGPQPGYSHEEQQLDAKIVRDRIYTAADYPLPVTEVNK